jgi:hypothetical protein
MKLRLTALQHVEVVAEDGGKLGRLMDLRTRAPLGPVDRREPLEPAMLLVGPSGWLEEMGLREGGAREVAAKGIASVSSGKIVVRAANARPERSRKRRRGR